MYFEKLHYHTRLLRNFLRHFCPYAENNSARSWNGKKITKSNSEANIVTDARTIISAVLASAVSARSGKEKMTRAIFVGREDCSLQLTRVSIAKIRRVKIFSRRAISRNDLAITLAQQLGGPRVISQRSFSFLFLSSRAHSLSLFLVKRARNELTRRLNLRRTTPIKIERVDKKNTFVF